MRGPGSVNGRRRAASRAAKAEPAQSARAGKEQSALKQEQLRQVIADLHKAREQAKLEKQSALSPMQEAKQEKKKACEAEGRARRKLADPELSTAEAARLREIEKQSQLKQEQLRKVIAELHKAREQEKLEEQSAIQLEQLRGLEWACIARAARPAGAVVTVAVTAAPLLFGCTSLHETFVSEKL